VKTKYNPIMGKQGMRMMAVPISGGAYISCLSCNAHKTKGDCEWLKGIGNSECWHPVGTIFVLDEERVR
jgi:hypothetical protein